jgi:hypothetical protein
MSPWGVWSFGQRLLYTFIDFATTFLGRSSLTWHAEQDPSAYHTALREQAPTHFFLLAGPDNKYLLCTSPRLHWLSLFAMEYTNEDVFERPVV